MAIVICNRYCLVFISRSTDLIQYGGIVTKANLALLNARQDLRSTGRWFEYRPPRSERNHGQVIYTRVILSPPSHQVTQRARTEGSSHGSVSVFNVGIGIRYFCRYFFQSVRYSVSVFQNIAISVRYFGISAGPL